jgi:hypothetical protein
LYGRNILYASGHFPQKKCTGEAGFVGFQHSEAEISTASPQFRPERTYEAGGPTR